MIQEIITQRNGTAFQSQLKVEGEKGRLLKKGKSFGWEWVRFSVEKFDIVSNSGGNLEGGGGEIGTGVFADAWGEI